MPRQRVVRCPTQCQDCPRRPGHDQCQLVAHESTPLDLAPNSIRPVAGRARGGRREPPDRTPVRPNEIAPMVTYLLATAHGSGDRLPPHRAPPYGARVLR
jgi:hypothetical protein